MTTTNEILALLRNSPAFAGLPAETLARIAERARQRALDSGETLAREGDPGDGLFLVISGSLALTRLSPTSPDPLSLGTAGPSQIVGELSLLTGQPRAATMQAAEPTVVLTLHNEDFDQLCAEFPSEMAATLAWMAGRLDAYQIVTGIEESPPLRALTPEAKRDLAAGLKRLDLPAGHILFREGEPGDALYLILNGRVRVAIGAPEPTPPSERSAESQPVPAPNQSTQTLAELGKGDLLGEMALLTSEPRSATVVAVRDSHLARLDRPAFDRIVAAYPREMLSLVSTQLAARLRQQNLGRPPEGRPPVSIAVLPLTAQPHPAAPLAAHDFAAELTSQLSAFGPTLHLNRTELDRIFGENRWGHSAAPKNRSTSTPQVNAAAERHLLSWLGDQEMLHRHVVYEADAAHHPQSNPQPSPQPSEWTIRCLRQADALLVVADAAADPAQIAQTLARLTSEAAPSLTKSLVLIHGSDPASAAPPRTAALKQALGLPTHHHVLRHSPADVARIARALNRQSVGLALGGGFALGLAHIGVIDAMRELDIPIDFVGGTSMGAIIGAACAREYSHDQMLEFMDKGCVQALKGDYTLPLVSLLTGRKVSLALGKYLAGLDIEDLWLPWFAISASLVSARMIVHRSGDALRSVLATCRAPGMFPPLGWAGDVLVDGGLVNNIPADVMRESVGSGTVFAADVSPAGEFTAANEFGLQVSGWQVAARNFNPFRRRRPMGTLRDILMRLIRLGGVAHNKQIRAAADLYMSVPLGSFTVRDFHRGEELSQAGHAHAKKELERWIATHGRPWLGSRG
jgi:CRP-like cAMP-binding protein/predicted acylesterase/phospholipase RssA